MLYAHTFSFGKNMTYELFCVNIKYFFVKFIVVPSMKIMPLRKTLPESASLNSSFIVSLKLEVKEPDSGSVKYIYMK